MKLAFVSDFYYPSIGGTQVLCQSLAEWFRDSGHDIEIITSPDNKRGNLDYVINELRGASFQGQSILLEKNYDAVFVFADLLSPSILSLNPGESKKTILILNLDENVYNLVKEEKINDIIKRVEAIKRFDYVVSFCQGAPVNRFLDENSIEYQFIPNFSRDTKKSIKSSKITKNVLGIDKKIIFNHGRLHPNKNIHKMIEAFSISNLKNEFSLVVLGAITGPECVQYLKKCYELIKANNLNKEVKIIKGTTNKVVIDSLLSLADVYFLPSPSEGLPLTLIEAMSAGLPWVSTPVGGVPTVFGKHCNGKVLPFIDFTPEEMEKAIYEVEGKNSRKDWEENYTVETIGNQYMNLLDISKQPTETIDFLKKHKISFGNQVYNEPVGIKNYLNSCLQFAGIIDEVYVINHRSSDNTLEVIESFENKYKESGIKLRWKTEIRDFSKDFTIADVFGAAVNGCENEIVFRHDADFIFGKGYLKTMSEAIKCLYDKSVYACGYEIPVVSKFLQMNKGVVEKYGFCNMHVSVPRVFKRTKTKCIQNHVQGKYEWFHPIDLECSKWATIPHFRESLLSVNIKPTERQELRETMNTFMQDLQAGKVDGNWLDNKGLRREKEEWANENNNMKKIDIIGEQYEL